MTIVARKQEPKGKAKKPVVLTETDLDKASGGREQARYFAGVINRVAQGTSAT